MHYTSSHYRRLGLSSRARTKEKSEMDHELKAGHKVHKKKNGKQVKKQDIGV